MKTIFGRAKKPRNLNAYEKQIITAVDTSPPQEYIDVTHIMPCCGRRVNIAGQYKGKADHIHMISCPARCGKPWTVCCSNPDKPTFMRRPLVVMSKEGGVFAQ